MRGRPLPRQTTALANRTTVLGTAANGRVFRVFATITVIVVAIMGVGALITKVSGLF
jgi:hypothetical protein